MYRFIALAVAVGVIGAVAACGDDGAAAQTAAPHARAQQAAAPPAVPSAAPNAVSAVAPRTQARNHVVSERAYVDGGMPLSNEDVDGVLIFDLPELVKSKANIDRARLQRMRDVFLAPAVRKPWERLLATLTGQRARDAFRFSGDLDEHIRTINAAFAKTGLGYYLETHVAADERQRERVVIYTYRVAYVATYHAAGAAYFVYELDGLFPDPDTTLGFQLGPLGFIRLDKARSIVDRYFVPVFDDSHELLLGGDGWGDSALGHELSAAMLGAERQELTAALGGASGVAKLERDDQLRGKLVELLVVTAGRHEAQHIIDEQHRRPLPASVSVPGMFLHSVVTDELTAHITQIANDPVTPRIAYAMSLVYGFAEHRIDIPQAHIAAIITEGLARHLGIAVAAPIIHDGDMDRDRMAKLAIAIFARSGDDVRAAAAALWRELYGDALVPITDR